MEVNKNELRAAIDCDDTLCVWPEDYFKNKPGRVRINCPYEAGTTYFLEPHLQHINLLKAQKVRGYEVTVWSQNGWAWAEAMVKALGLVEFVDRVETKFSKMVDDIPPQEWINHVYIPYRPQGE